MTTCDKHRKSRKSLKSIVLLIGLLLAACQDERAVSYLNESELFFNEILSSISADPADSDIFYIGTEDGVIFRYNASSGQVSDTLHTKFDRIYKVLRDTTKGREGTYWVGTRNMGLFRCEMKSDSLKPMKKQGRFFIHATNKATKYSAYDISVTPTGIYVATSHGLQKIQMYDGTITSDYLDVLWPEFYRPQEHQKDLRPLVVGNIVKCNDSILYCASDSGLLCVRTNIKEDDGLDDVKTLRPGKEFFNVVQRSGTLKGVYVLSKDSLYKLDDNNKFHPYIENNQAQVYFYDSLCGINYLLSTNHMTLLEDCDSESLKKRHTISLKRPLRILCHNIIVPDTDHGRILLLTEHSLLRIGNHQGILDSADKATHACVDGQYIYYLSGTRLFRQDLSDSNNNIQAKQIAEIHSKEVNFMIVSNGVLYYVDGDNASFRMSLQNNLFLNTILPWAWKTETDSKTDEERDVTAIGCDSNNVYIGIRDGFRNINGPEMLNLSYDVKEGNKIKCDAPFITCFARSPKGGQTLLGTLNDGIYSGTDNKFSLIKGTKPDSMGLFSFIRDICIVPGVKDSIYVLTNHKLIRQYGNSFRTDSIDVTGFYRLFVLDSIHVFGVKGFGITNLSNGITLYPDVQFNPKACVLAKGKLYAGSNGGVYVIDPTSTNTVHFVEDNIFTRQNLITILLLLFFALGILWLLDRLRLSRQAIESRIEELGHSISLLEEKKGILSPPLCQKIDELRSKLEDIDPDGRKKALDKLDALRNEITEIEKEVKEIIKQQDMVDVRKKDLNKRLANLADSEEYLPESIKKQIDGHRSTLQTINPVGVEYASKKLDKLGEDIGKTEREVVRELRDRLQRQIKNIESSDISDAPDYAAESRKVADGLKLSEMFEQIKSNKIFLDKAKMTKGLLMEEYKFYIFSDCDIPKKEEVRNIMDNTRMPQDKKRQSIRELVEEVDVVEMNKILLNYLIGQADKCRNGSISEDTPKQFKRYYKELEEEYSKYSTKQTLSLPNDLFEIGWVEQQFVTLESFNHLHKYVEEFKENKSVLELLRKQINDIYAISDNHPTNEINMCLKKTVKKKKGDKEYRKEGAEELFLPTRLLYLLIAAPDIKLEQLSEILNVAGRSVRRAKDDLYKEIDDNYTKIVERIKKKESIYGRMILYLENQT